MGHLDYQVNQKPTGYRHRGQPAEGLGLLMERTANSESYSGVLAWPDSVSDTESDSESTTESNSESSPSSAFTAQ